jgi:hypothetical protein
VGRSSTGVGPKGEGSKGINLGPLKVIQDGVIEKQAKKAAKPEPGTDTDTPPDLQSRCKYICRTVPKLSTP